MTLVPDDSAYFPLQLGDYWVYQVTQEKYVSLKSSVKQTYQVQEKISSSYIQNGALVYLVEESVRPTGQSSWKLNGIHIAYKNVSEAISQENNLPIIKLTFPIGATISWNKNAYNNNPDTLLTYRDVGRSFATGKLAFNNTISVVEPGDSNLVEQKKHLRVYASGIGLVYREDLSLAFCQSSPACIGKSIIESGSTLRWEIIGGNRLP